jgi:hypothetical protein
MTRVVLAAAIVAVIAPEVAVADPPVNLKLRRVPTPRHLRMRPRTAATPTPDATTPPTTPTPTPVPAPADGKASGKKPGALAPIVARAADFDLKGIRRADEQIVFRLDLGFGVDGGAISGRRAVAGEPLSASDYREVRAHGFGNLFVGTRGLIIPPLSSYLSVGFRIAPNLSSMAPLADALDSTRDVQIRAGWAEATNFLPGILRPLRVRAGRQYAYGPWPIHFDGSLFAWTSKPLQVSALVGARVDDYAPQGEPVSRQPVGALIGALDLGALGRWPITVRGTLMWLSERRFADLELGYRPRRGLVVVAGLRRIGDKPARERATVRAQVSDVTHVVVDVEHRRATDWRWDLAFVDPVANPGEARPYLELPAVIPQLRASIRAGTVLLDNIDLFGRAGLAVDLVDRPDERTGHAELGVALEVRFRRQIALTASAMVRDYELTDPVVQGNQQVDVGNVAQPLVDPTNPDQASSLGQESFVEGGLGFRFTTGAKRFSVTGEGYGRRARYGFLYEEDTPLVGDLLDRNDLRGGLRFRLDGWLSPRLRLHVEYDLSSTLDNAPEINGWKVLRILAEGSF